jgi:hypothetical protein
MTFSISYDNLPTSIKSNLEEHCGWTAGIDPSIIANQNSLCQQAERDELLKFHATISDYDIITFENEAYYTLFVVRWS